MIKSDDFTNKNKLKHNLNCPYIPDHPYRIITVGGSVSGKSNAWLNLINHEPYIDKMYLHAKDSY